MSTNNIRVVAPTPSDALVRDRSTSTRHRVSRRQSSSTASPNHEFSASASASPSVKALQVPRHNLRSTASSLAAHLERNGHMSIATLTECVLRDTPSLPCAAASAKQESLEAQPATVSTPDLIEAAAAAERNSCRRIYDAIKVMCAVGIATRTSDKQLFWRGRSHIVPPTQCFQTPSRPIHLLSNAHCTSPVTKGKRNGRRDANRRDGKTTESLTFATLSPSTSNESSPAAGTGNLEVCLNQNLNMYTSLSPSSPVSTITTGAPPNESDSRSSPTRIRASMRVLKAAVTAKRIRNESISARIAAYATLRNRRRKNRKNERLISVPFVLLRGEPSSVTQSNGCQNLELNFTGRPPELYSETDILVMLHKRTKKLK